MGEPLKNHFAEPVVRRLGGEIAAVYPGFDRKGFERDALKGFLELELLDRGRHLARVLRKHLPADFGKAVDILLATLPVDKSPVGGMASFYYMPHTELIRQFGVDHLAHSLRALHALTQVFTAEFALRPFLEHHTRATLAQLGKWTRDPSEHVRRLVSEGTRPRLPWAPRLNVFVQDPAPVIELLDRLKDDPSLYVRRSVANHLNDIGKEHPKVLFKVAREWMVNATPERRWVIEHALRSSIKRGDSEALAILGFASTSPLKIVEHTFTPARVKLGGRVGVSVTLVNPTKRAQQAVVDLLVHFVKASGGTSPKVFKLSKVELAPGESVVLKKTVSFADLTTRKHYPGLHKVEVQINGVARALGTFKAVA
jgi:3-methyladenine DNA glycosylase AlkC